jgi:hypothetical protein
MRPISSVVDVCSSTAEAIETCVWLMRPITSVMRRMAKNCSAPVRPSGPEPEEDREKYAPA